MRSGCGGQKWSKKLGSSEGGRLGGAVLFLREGSISQDDDKNSFGEEAFEVLKDWLQGWERS